MQLLQQAATRFDAAGVKYAAATAKNFLGIALDYQGKTGEARASYADAVRIFGELGETPSEAVSLANIAVLDFQAGNYIEAVSTYERELGKLDPIRDRESYVTILNNLGVAQSILGNADESVAALTKALPLTEGSTLSVERARVLHNLGRTYLNLGEQERGSVFAGQALELRQADPDRDRRGLLTSLLLVGELSRDAGDTQKALKLHIQALDQVRSPQEQIRVLFAIGKDQMAAGEIGAALDTYQRALKLDLPADWPVRVSVSGAFGYALSRSGKAEGRRLLLKSAQAHEAADDNELAAQDYYLLASEERRGGQVDAALRDVGRAIALFTGQRIRAVNPDLRATYVANRTGAYELQADLYMTLRERAKNAAEQERLGSAALGSAELLRARALEDFRQFAQAVPEQGEAAEGSKVAELDARLAAKRNGLARLMDLENPPADRIAAVRREIALLRTELDIARKKQTPTDAKIPTAGPLSLSELQRSLAADTTIITWLPGETRSWIWCITRTQARSFALSAGHELEAAARELHVLWSHPPSGSGASKRELEASRMILGEAAAMIAEKPNLVVVADGALRAIPLGALWIDRAADGQRHRLAETTAVSYRPALKRWTIATPSVVVQTPRILLVGDPVIIGDNQHRSAADMRGTALADPAAAFQPLPGSRREVDGIIKVATGWQTDVLLGPDATKSAVLRQPLGSFRVLHFATHARLDVHDPQLSSIVLSSKRADVGRIDSSLSLREIIGLGLHADAVVLSACEGSLGKEYRGQLSFGLSEAFLLAGANNVLGTLWKVSDTATDRYMQRYYENYMRLGLSSVAAAQAAARVMMSDPKYSHPFYWAGFVVLSS